MPCFARKRALVFILERCFFFSLVSQTTPTSLGIIEMEIGIAIEIERHGTWTRKREREMELDHMPAMLSRGYCLDGFLKKPQ
jgi:hypothetical protein